MSGCVVRMYHIVRMYGVSVSDNVKQTVSNLSGTWGGGGEEKRREGVQLLCDREEKVCNCYVTEKKL